MTTPLPSRPSEVKAWCIAQGFHPNRTLGQNFLIDRNTVDGILAAANVQAGTKVLEVGPGMGALTHALLDARAEVTAIEKDTRLAELLAESCGQAAGFRLTTADMLDIDLGHLLATGEALVRKADKDAPLPGAPYFDLFLSNLPYSVGTRILLEVCRHRLAPSCCVVMVQKEVADRLAAKPSTPDRGQAGVWIQQNYDVEAVKVVKPTCFWPKPEIASTVVRLTRHDRFPLTPAERKTFETISKLAFMHRRKQMVSTFRQAAEQTGLPDEATVCAWIEAAGLDPKIRPEAIANEAWIALAKALPAFAKETAR